LWELKEIPRIIEKDREQQKQNKKSKRLKAKSDAYTRS